MPWGNNNGYASAPNFAPRGNFAPVAYGNAPVAAQAPAVDYNQLKAMWEAQRKQADEMLKRIEAAQNTAAK